MRGQRRERRASFFGLKRRSAELKEAAYLRAVCSITVPSLSWVCGTPAARRFSRACAWACVCVCVAAQGGDWHVGARAVDSRGGW